MDSPRGLRLQQSLRGASVPRSVTGDSRGGAAASIRPGDGALMDGTRIGRRAFLAAGWPLGLGALGLAAPNRRAIEHLGGRHGHEALADT